MSFNTLDFMLLFAGTFILYYLLPHKLRNPLLLIASLVFYAAYNLGLTLYLVAVTLFSYLIALGIDRFRGEKDGKVSKYLMTAGVVIDVGVLAFYKYFNFLAANLAGVFGTSASVSHRLVPLGISFITFSTVSYIIDVYRTKYPAEKNLLKYSLYVAFFPKVVQGPIEKAGDILPQFDQVHRFDLIRFREGMLMMLYGLFMKMVVADTAAMIVDTVYGSLKSYSGAAILLATLMFTLQLYCDFAGYSLTAIGAAKVLGFDFKQNFRQPYLSLSVAEFWRRWHMSLNRWLVDYLYIPLGGSRCSRSRKNFNTLVTFGVSGLWHGADWGYIIWGLLNGVYIIAESAVKRLFGLIGKKPKGERAEPEKAPSGFSGAVRKFFQWLITFILIVLSWIFFRARKLPAAVLALKRIFTRFQLKAFVNYVRAKVTAGGGASLFGLDVAHGYPVLLAGLLIIIVVDLLANRRYNAGKAPLAAALANGHRVWRWAIAMILIFAIMIFGVYGYGYGSGAFIYAGF